MSLKQTCEAVNNCFIDIPPFINDEICNRSPKYQRHWWGLVPQINLDFSRGYDRTKYTFRSSGIPQDLEWETVQEERSPGTLGPTDPGHDPCAYKAHLIEHSLEAKQYNIFRTHVRTNKFCLDSMLFKHKFKDQVSMMVDGLVENTIGVYEAAHKKFALLNYDIFIAQESRQGFLQSKFEATELDELPSIAGIPVTPLSIDHLSLLYNLLMIDVPQFGLGMTNGQPDFGVSTSAETIDSLYSQTPSDFDILKRRPDNNLLDGYGFTYSRKHFIMMSDPRANRYKETSPGSGKLVQVHQEKLDQAFCGTGAFASEEYAFTAPFELTFLMYQPGAAFSVEIPLPDTMLAGGADFSPRNYFGDFRFVRPPEDCGNEKRNFGWWFAEYMASPQPGCMRGVAILHRRCFIETFDLGFCSPCDIPTCPDPLPAKAGVVLVGGEPTQLDIDLTGTVFSLPLVVGSIVAFELESGDFEAGVVIANGSDPVHRFQFNSDATAYVTTGGTNPIVACTDPGLPACGIVCNCFQDPEGATTELLIQVEEQTINLGVGATINVNLGDASSVNATITAIVGSTTWPTYELTFGGDRVCVDNGGVISIGTCP